MSDVESLLITSLVLLFEGAHRVIGVHVCLVGPVAHPKPGG
jgi:hypothetical protein